MRKSRNGRDLASWAAAAFAFGIVEQFRVVRGGCVVPSAGARLAAPRSRGVPCRNRPRCVARRRRHSVGRLVRDSRDGGGGGGGGSGEGGGATAGSATAGLVDLFTEPHSTTVDDILACLE